MVYEIDPMIVMPPTPRLETARLLLEPISMRDAPVIQRRFPRWEIVRHLGARVPWPYPPDGAESFLRTLLQAMEAGRKNAWGLWLKGGPDEVIGIIELWPPDPTTRDGRGFWIDPEFQRRGLMTEAADRVVDYAFGELGWPFLWLGNAKSNIASARVKQRQGAVLIDEVPFVFVGGAELRQVWLLRAEDWKKRRA
jgi:RimJ/RimL family protein N-acetyltransferase